MSVKIVITRLFKAEKIEAAYQLLAELRSKATVQNGYLSGETLVSADNPHKVVVVSSWLSRKRWDEWYSSPKRAAFSEKIAPLLDAPESYEVFLVGRTSPEWVHMA
ncbi:MAG: antibiotic biosynthesis monooxygenase [Thermodesulfobacteriota bacterium]